MSLMPSIAFLAMAAVPVLSEASSSDGAIRVHVFAGDPKAGFVDPEAKDSARDLTEALRKKKAVRLVNEQDKADVWVRVDKRFIRATGGAVATDTGSTAVAVPLDEHVVQATLGAGDYSTEIAGANDWGYKRAAGKLADKVEKWLEQNRDQLLSRRPKE